eukprot:CAMPEP_0180655626 /NCGR_PEP_ID=MMETSP1037_2-20121125/55381_1 /TAXON_ID=632150 /ORGANISM="Azadinium spinosum, Strain 3D9" /LENGTH=47 /DNA_ID= /DNA_START= /DNA_END= /DNA_ORIENTATION=
MPSLARLFAALSSCSFFFDACCASSLSKRACRAWSISSFVFASTESD